MAHRITYKPSGIILSSAIGDIGIEVDGSYVDVTLTAPGNIVILSERYYAYGSRVTLYDIATLIEAEMRNAGYSVANFTLRVFTDTVGNKADSWTLHVLYCDRYAIGNDIPNFLLENFLTTLPVRRLAFNSGSPSTVSLSFYAETGESLEYSVHYRFRKRDSDALYSHSFIMQGGRTASAPGIYQIDLPMASIIADAASFATARLGEISLLSFIIRCGQRSLTFFVDYSLEDRETFFFRNCFNVWDYAAVPVFATAKTDVDRSTAIINGTSQFYDQSVTKKYEVEAGPLTSDEAEWIDQLFTAYDVFRIEADATNPDDPYLLAPVLITDCTCEMQSGDEKLNIAKFTWRYADNRPVVHLSASPGIFTSPYNIVFS